jgi:hypothetical protein
MVVVGAVVAVVAEVEATAQTGGTILLIFISLSRKPTVIPKTLSATYHVLSM